MEDDDSSSTSCDDKSVFNDNPTRDALADGLMSFLKPRVDNIYKLMDTVKYITFLMNLIIPYATTIIICIVDIFTEKIRVI